MHAAFELVFYPMAGLKIDEFSRAKMDATAKELIDEKSLAYSCLD
jgi:malate dehydrogenase